MGTERPATAREVLSLLEIVGEIERRKRVARERVQRSMDALATEELEAVALIVEQLAAARRGRNERPARPEGSGSHGV